MAAAYDPNFVGQVDADAKAAFQHRLVEKLSEVLEQEVEGVMAEYIVVMVGNQKTMKEIHDEMVDFMGAESAAAAVACIYKLLLEPSTAAAAEASPSPSPSASPSPEPSSEEPAAPPKKIINLSGVKASTSVDLSSKSSGTIRVIGSSSKDIKDALKSRSERFGLPEKKFDEPKPAATNSRPTTSKLSITERLGGRVNDKKDSSRGDQRSRQDQRPSRSESRDTNKRKGGDLDDKPPNSRSSRDNEDGDQRPSKRPARDPKGGDGRYPPGPGGHGPRGGPYPFPPMFQGYPPYHMPPPDFMYPPYPPPHHMPGFGYPGMPRGPYPPRMPHGGGAPRRFNNKWVNPGSAPADGDGDAKAKSDADQTSAAEPSSDHHKHTTPFPGGAPMAPRGYGFGYPRPRFQNKTWVRPDPKENSPQADETLSASLPKTP